MEIYKDSIAVSGLRNGHTTVGLTAVAITTNDWPCKRGIWFRAPGDSDGTPNTVAVWVGRKGVTADSTVTTGGYPLMPGDTFFLPVDDASEVYAISTSAAQDLAWIAL